MTDGEKDSVVGAVTTLGRGLMTALPAQFLALCMVTLVFNLGMLWFWMHETDQRARLIGRVLDACIPHMPAHD